VESNVALAYATLPVYSALIFWSFIAIVAVAGMVKEFANKREVQRTLRAAIEKGQALDPAVVATITRTSSMRPETLSVAGIIVVAAGGGLMLLGYFIGKLAEAAFYPIIGSGCLATTVGLGLFVAAWFLRRAEVSERKPM
jgi:hypothetical protein